MTHQEPVTTINMVGVPPEPLLDLAAFALEYQSLFMEFLRERICANCAEKHLEHLGEAEDDYALVKSSLELVKESAMHSMDLMAGGEQHGSPQPDDLPKL